MPPVPWSRAEAEGIAEKTSRWEARERGLPGHLVLSQKISCLRPFLAEERKLWCPVRVVERGFRENLSCPEGDRAILEILGMISKIACINARVIYWIAAILQIIINNALLGSAPRGWQNAPCGKSTSLWVRLSLRPHLQMQMVLFTQSALKPKLMYASVLDLEMQALHMLGKSSTTQVYAPGHKRY